VIQLDLIWALILGELLLVLALSLTSVLFLNARGRRQDRQAAMHLVGAIKASQGQHLEDTRHWLATAYGLRDEPLSAAAHGILRAETLLYQRIVNLYVKRDRFALQELNIDVETVGEAFRSLRTGSDTPPEATEVAPNNGGDAEDERLRAENEALKQEIQITMETMSRMLGEYAAMFGSEAPAAATDGQYLAAEQHREPGLPAAPEEYTGENIAQAPEELDDLMADDRTLVLDVPDLSATTGTGLDRSGDGLGADVSPGGATMDLAEEMDDELADVWAEALAEQERSDEDK
jgi:hypothetical protein